MGIFLSGEELETPDYIAFARNKECLKRKSKKKTKKKSSNLKSIPFRKKQESNETFLDNGCIAVSKITKTKTDECMLSKRKDCVDKLLLSYKDNEKFNSTFDRLIDIEESFISEQP